MTMPWAASATTRLTSMRRAGAVAATGAGRSQLLARKGGVLGKFYHPVDGYPKHGDFHRVTGTDLPDSRADSEIIQHRGAGSRLSWRSTVPRSDTFAGTEGAPSAAGSSRCVANPHSASRVSIPR